MIKKGVFVFLSLVILATAAYAAPDRVGKVDAGINVSGILPRESDVHDAVYVGGTVAYGVTPWLALGVESGWTSPGVDLDLGNGVSIDAGDLTGIPLLGDIILRVPMKDGNLVPYGVVGLGAIFWNFDESSLFSAAGINVDVDTSFAAKFGGGVDYFVNDNWILNFEFGYVIADANITATAGGVSVSDSSNADYWMVGGGVKYLFS